MRLYTAFLIRVRKRHVSKRKKWEINTQAWEGEAWEDVEVLNTFWKDTMEGPQPATGIVRLGHTTGNQPTPIKSNFFFSSLEPNRFSEWANGPRPAIRWSEKWKMLLDSSAPESPSVKFSDHATKKKLSNGSSERYKWRNGFTLETVRHVHSFHFPRKGLKWTYEVFKNRKVSFLYSTPYITSGFTMGGSVW